MTLTQLAAKTLTFALLGVALVGCVGAIGTGAAKKEAAALAEYPPSGQFVDVNGVRVHALVAGRGPDLVLIHGSSGNLRDFTFSMVDRLSKRYRVIAFDRPGLGYTERLPGKRESITEQAALLQAAAAKLGARKPVVLGHSYGGAVALAWAVERPDDLSALVVLAGASQPWEGELSGFYKLTSSGLGQAVAVPAITAFTGEARVESALRSVFAPQPVPKGYGDHIGAGLTLRRESLKANADQRASLKGEIIALQPRYPAIRVPTEIVHGSADRTVGLDIHSRPLATQIPKARLTVLPGIGHMPHQVAGAQVIAAIDRAAARAGLR